MASKKRTDIQGIADEIRELLGISECNFDIVAVVERLNGKIEYFSGRDAYRPEEVVKSGGSGAKGDGPSFVMHIDRDNPEARRRFSIAHEIGHLFLHMNYPHKEWDELPAGASYRREPFLRPVREVEANEFAASFLMPKALFFEVAEQTSSESHYLVKKIADKFNVSVTAASYRGMKLGLWD